MTADTDQYVYGQGKATLAEPVRSGYTFVGWYSSSDCSSDTAVNSISTTDTGDVELYAKWEESTVAVTGVTLNRTTLSLKEGATATLQATIAPTDATNKEVVWSTSNSAVATVEDGTVKAVKAGTATITVTTVDGTKTAECTVTVTAVTQDKDEEIDKTYQVTFNSTGGSTVAAQTVKEGATVTKPADPTRKGYKFAGWYLGNTAYSFTTPVKGKITLTAKWAEIKVTKIKLTGISKQIAAGKKIKLTATVTPTTAKNRAVTWKSSNKKYATVTSKGVVTLKKAGIGKTVKITATAKD